MFTLRNLLLSIKIVIRLTMIYNNLDNRKTANLTKYIRWISILLVKKLRNKCQLGCERTGSDNACVRARVSRQTILLQN